MTLVLVRVLLIHPSGGRLLRGFDRTISELVLVRSTVFSFELLRAVNHLFAIVEPLEIKALERSGLDPSGISDRWLSRRPLEFLGLRELLEFLEREFSVLRRFKEIIWWVVSGELPRRGLSLLDVSDCEF